MEMTDTHHHRSHFSHVGCSSDDGGDSLSPVKTALTEARSVVIRFDAPGSPTCKTVSYESLTRLWDVIEELHPLCQAHPQFHTEALALSVATYARELWDLPATRLFTHAARNTSDCHLPPGWADGIVVIPTEQPANRDINHVTAAATSTTRSLLVDCGFRAKFVVARPTAEYAHYLHSHVPDVFVGTLKHLEEAVTEVTAQLQQSLTQSGLEVPPWRSRPCLMDMYARCISSTSSDEWYREGQGEAMLHCTRQHLSLTQSFSSSSSSSDDSRSDLPTSVAIVRAAVGILGSWDFSGRGSRGNEQEKKDMALLYPQNPHSLSDSDFSIEKLPVQPLQVASSGLSELLLRSPPHASPRESHHHHFWWQEPHVWSPPTTFHLPWEKTSPAGLTLLCSLGQVAASWLARRFGAKSSETRTRQRSSASR